MQEEALFGVDWDGPLPHDDNTSAVVASTPPSLSTQPAGVPIELTNVLDPLDDQNEGICLFKDWILLCQSCRHPSLFLKKTFVF